MITRESILESPTYHLAGIGLDIFQALIPHLYPGVELPPQGEPLPYPSPGIYKELAQKCGTREYTIRRMASVDYQGSLKILTQVLVALGIAPSLAFSSLKSLE